MVYECKLCKFSSDNKTKYQRHLETKKHKKNSEDKVEELKKEIVQNKKEADLLERIYNLEKQVERLSVGVLE